MISPAALLDSSLFQTLPMPDVPADAAAIDAAWLTRALRASGAARQHGAVTAVQVETLGGSQGFAGTAAAPARDL